MKKLVIYKCKICGNTVIKLVDKGVPLMCCGTFMEELVPASSDGAVEKHMPVVSVDGNVVIVTVGEVPHPMTEGHYISHIIALTDKGYYVKELQPKDQPRAKFTLTDESLVSVYSLCNLHGAWAKNI